MTQSLTAWAVLSAILFMGALIAIWSRRNTRWRGMAVLAVLISVPMSAAAIGYALGWPAPLLKITAPTGDWVILGDKMIRGQGIYLLIDIPGGEPRYYRMPWDDEEAKKLQELKNKKQGAMLRFDPSLEQFAEIHPLPQPKFMPPKRQPSAPPRYERGA